MKEQHVWHATQNAYEDYTVDMSVNASEVLTPDDKDKKFMVLKRTATAIGSFDRSCEC